MSERPKRQSHSEGCDSKYYEQYDSVYMKHKGEKLCNCVANGWNACIDAYEQWEKSQPKDAVSLDIKELCRIIHAETITDLTKTMGSISFANYKVPFKPRIFDELYEDCTRKLKGQDNEANNRI